MRLRTFLKRDGVFIGHVMTMMSGKVVAAAIALFAAPIIARLFDPSDFGVAAVFMSIVGMLSTIAAFSYDGAIVLPPEDREALELMTFSYRVSILFCVAMITVIAVLELSGNDLRRVDILGVWKWLLPVGVFLQATVKIQESWLMRRKSFKRASLSLVTGSIVGSGSRITLGIVGGTSVYGLIVGNLMGTTSRMVMQQPLCREGLRAVFRPIEWNVTKRIAGRYSDFPRLNAPANIIFSLGQNLPILLFGIMFSPATAGLYAMANRLVSAPVRAVANSMRQVFKQKVAEINNRGRSLRTAFLKATAGLAVLGLLPVAIIWSFGQPLVGWLLGDRWGEAGRYLEIIAPWIFMIWVTAPCNSVFVVLRKQSFWLAVQTLLTGLRLTVFGFSYLLSLGVEATLQYFVIATVLGNMVTILFTFVLISRHPNGYATVSED
jgi:O-antigen/teichoic acid export membrane protein